MITEVARRPRIALLPGDGIGPEVIAEVRRLIEALRGRDLLGAEVIELDWGADRYLATGVGVPPGGFELLASCDAVLVGALGDPRVPAQQHAREILLGMREKLDLFANVRPVRCRGERLNPLKRVLATAIDLIVVRENTEGLYAGVGGAVHGETEDEVAVEEMIVTRRGVERVLRLGFELARRRRGRVTLVDKANALRHVGSLWRRAFRTVAQDFQGVETEQIHVDHAALLFITEPSRFDVVVTGNLFGDILSEIGAALQGGLGLAPSANLHPGRTSMFEPVHGAASDLAGRAAANPLAAFASFALLLRHLRNEALADRLEAAVADVALGDVTTPDLGGTASTREVGDAVTHLMLEGRSS
jgi:3-isopropylmalate dehydrogenase